VVKSTLSARGIRWGYTKSKGGAGGKKGTVGKEKRKLSRVGKMTDKLSHRGQKWERSPKKQRGGGKDKRGKGKESELLERNEGAGKGTIRVDLTRENWFGEKKVRHGSRGFPPVKKKTKKRKETRQGGRKAVHVGELEDLFSGKKKPRKEKIIRKRITTLKEGIKKALHLAVGRKAKRGTKLVSLKGEGRKEKSSHPDEKEGKQRDYRGSKNQEGIGK